MSLDQNQFLDALRGILEPSTQRDVVKLGFVRSIAFNHGVVQVDYQLPPALATQQFIRMLSDQTTTALTALPGVTHVNVDCAALPPPPPPLRGVKNIVAVGAGKGGVGKSTVAVLAAVGLARMGLKVGLLDGDVYGPSIPKMTGTEGEAPDADEYGRIEPLERDGVKVLSMGHIVSADQAIVWRGPMAQKYVKEFLDRGVWEGLDYLLVDLPPGTGDIPLTLAQSVPLSGAVVVCTPQDVALLDAVKAIRMYQKLNVDVIGIVENMSYYVCPHCGKRDEIFSHGGAGRTAMELGIPMLGEIPLNIGIRVEGDAGSPSRAFTHADPAVRAALEAFCKRLHDEVQRRGASRTPLPQLNIR
ncbi:MAG: Mrp/NBP35 family ATP-binding protein [Phycisphaerales bacterium]|nr:Mrp/NBP35 family ATP-binding protein [Phycisphaerales bacterium]